MGKIKFPYMQWFTSDWLSDECVSKCRPATRGVWKDFLDVMHQNDRSGVITGTREQLARLGRCTAVELDAALEDLSVTKTADVTERDGIVTVVNRRMKRDAKSRNSTVLRVRRFRERKECNGFETAHSTDTIVQNRSLSHSTAGSKRQHPKLEDVKAWASIDGIPEPEAEAFWHHFESSGWIDKHGHAVRNPRSKLKSWHLNERLRSDSGNRNRSDPFWKDKAELELVEKEIAKIQARASTTANSTIIQPGDVKPFEQLKKRRSELKQKLGLAFNSKPVQPT